MMWKTNTTYYFLIVKRNNSNFQVRLWLSEKETLTEVNLYLKQPTKEQLLKQDAQTHEQHRSHKGKSRFRMRQILKPHSKNKVPTLFLRLSRPQCKLFMGAGANEAEEERKGIPGNQIK